MDREKIFQKFGNGDYQINDDTFVMGIHCSLAESIAQRFNGHNVILDSCCGAGFMSLALAKYVNQVVAVEISLEHLEQAKINSKIAGVSPKIQFIHGDILDKIVLNKIPEIGGAFLDPDWASMGDNKKIHTSKLSDMQPSADKLFTKISKKTKNIVLRLPKEIDLLELRKLPRYELEKVYLDNDFKFYCVYFGGLVKKVGETELKVFSK